MYVEVFGETAGGRLIGLNHVKWRCEEGLKLQMIPPQMSPDSIIQYVSVQLKHKSKNEAHIKHCHNHGNHDRCEDQNHRGSKEDRGTSSEDGRRSSGGESMTCENHKEAHFFAFVAHNSKEHGQDKSKWRRAPPRGGMGKPHQRIVHPPLYFKEYRREHKECCIYYAKNLPHTHTITRCARSTRRTSELTSKPTPRRCPKSSI